jgi:uncharacterized protein (TIGR03083 family)
VTTLDPDALAAGIIRELEAFEELLVALPEGAWTQRTSFWGLPVGDVAAHVTGVITDVVRGATDGLASPLAVTRQLAERDVRTRQEIVAELRVGRLAAEGLVAALDAHAWQQPAPSYDGTLADAVEDLWEDVWVHGEDIRSAVGLPSDHGPGLENAIRHVARRLERHGWGPAVIELDGLKPVVIGPYDDDAIRVTAEPVTFVRVATGRVDPSTIGLGWDVVVAT